MTTKQKILDVAESLFAEQGFEVTSLRDITVKAEVNLASVNYHFGSKKGLLQELVRRRLVPLNKERLELLTQYEVKAGSDPVSLEKIYEAYLGPVFKPYLRGASTSLNKVFMMMMMRVFSELPDFAKEMYATHFKEAHLRFLGAIQKTLPHLSEEEVHWRFHFALSLIKASITHQNRVKVSSSNICDPDDIKGLVPRLIKFICAGYRA